MANFVLVPGAFQGGWSYERLRPLLEAEGHSVVAAELTGVGEREHLAGSGLINLDTHIADIVNLIKWRDLKDVILCGHSYGGMVITGVADQLPDRIATLVYIDAHLPQNGDTEFTLLPIVAPMAIDNSAALGGFKVAPLPAAAFGVGEEYQAWVDSKLTPHPFACLAQRLTLTDAYKSVAKRLLIYNTTDIGMPMPMAGWYEALRGNPGDHVFGIGGGHLLMIDNAQGVADILLQSA